MLTLFIQVPTVGMLIKKFKLNKLTSLEKIEQEQTKIIMNIENIKRISGAFDRGVITIEEFKMLDTQFRKAIAESQKVIKDLTLDKTDFLKRAISINSL